MTTAAEAPLKRSLLIAFALPTLVLGIMHGPEGQIQAIYGKHAHLDLTLLAAAMLLTKIFDAVTYPLIGTLSDRSFARTGTRRSWVLGGMLVSVLGMWFLMRPPPGVDVVYFGVWMAVLYVGWKLMEIPLLAWSYGLSPDPKQRARVQGWRALSLMVGQMLFYAMPYLAKALGQTDSSELDFRSLGVAAIVCAVALPLATLLMVWRVPSGSLAAAPVVEKKRYGVKGMIQAVRDNPPLVRLMAAFLPVNLLGGMSGGVAYFYIDAYLGLSQQFPAIMMASLLTTLVAIPFWTAMAMRYEPNRVWAISLLTGGIACLCFALVPPGPLAAPATFVLYPTIVLTLIGAVIVFTLLADIVDYGKLKTGEDHAGLYSSIFAFLQRSMGGVASAAGVWLVGWMGFDPALGAAAQTANGILGIKVAGAVLPGVGLLLAALIIWQYPLSRARVKEIQAELKLREQAAGGTAA